MSIKHRLLRMRFNADARILFYETLRDKVRDEIAVYEVIKRVEASATLFKVFPIEVLRDIMSSMRGSQRRHDASLGAALQQWVPPMESALISAGERAGRLDVALDEVANLLQAQSNLRSAVVSNLAYPLVLMLMLAALLSALGTFLIPMLEEMLPRPEWPKVASFMGFLADNSSLLTFGLLAGVGGVSVAFALTAQRWVGPVRDFFDRYVPLWSHYRSTQGVMMLTTLSMLTAAGVPTAAAIQLLRDNTSPWMATHMSRILMRMRSGQADGFALAGDGATGTLFDAYSAWQISLYSANLSMSTKLKSLSQTGTKRVSQSIGRSSGILKWAVMVAVALLLIMTYVSYMSVTSLASKGAL